jgi:hypothetical protein
MLIEEPAFTDLDFGEEPVAVESAAAHTAAPAPASRRDDGPSEVPPPVAPESGATSGGIAYITVTDAAGRVLFRRAATPLEVVDALRSADSAVVEGEAAMDRISYDRLYSELNGPAGPAAPNAPKS